VSPAQSDTGPAPPPEKRRGGPQREGRHHGTIAGLSIRPYLANGKAEKQGVSDSLLSVAAMQWDFDQDRAEKLLRLALCPSAPQGEWQAAALAYFRALRAAGATTEKLRELLSSAAPQAPPDPTPVVRFGRYRFEAVRWIVEHDPAYAEWLVRAVTTLSPALRSELRCELATIRNAIIEAQDREG